VLARLEAFMNFAISRMLVPVDFSPHSELALRYATALASRLMASVQLLHVVDDPMATGPWSLEVPIPDLSELLKNLIANAEHRLEGYRAAVGHPRVPMTTTVRTGHSAQTITEYAKAGGIDLIVMGTHGRSGLAHLVMGSVAESVVRHAPCPVLTLRETATRGKTEAAFTAQPAAVGSAVGSPLGSALGHLGTSRE
jgi:nucleotide-binding universal stress UspA family protein